MYLSPSYEGRVRYGKYSEFGVFITGKYPGGPV